MKYLMILCVAAGSLCTADSPLPVPLERAHAHNDYRHARPLLDALDAGFCSIEADIHLVDGKLLVAHDAKEVDPERTLENLYLMPLRERVETHQGRVYPNGPTVTLLIDIKTEGEATWKVLQATLQTFAPMLTHYSDTETIPGAVSVVVSGDCPRESILKFSPRLAGVDGRLPDLDGPLNAHQAPLISASWRDAFQWLGKEPMGEEESAKLKAMVDKAHARGQRIRFWGLPMWPLVWPTLYDAGVDLINADNLTGLRDFLLERGPARASSP